MNRLIRANFSRLFKNVIFRICMLFSIGLGVFADLSRYIDMQKNKDLYARLGDEFKCADGFLFSGSLYIIFAAAVFVGIFVGTEYSDGTIRNKIIVGHSRFKIYLSNFIVCAAGNLMMILSFIIVTFALGRILFTAKYLSFNDILLFTLCNCISMLALTSLIVLGSMLIKSKAAGSVTILMTTIILFFAAMMINSRLNESEYYQEPIFTVNEETGETYVEYEGEKNPNYLTGTKRKIYIFLNDFLPVNQFTTVMQNNKDKADIMALYSLIIIIAGNAVGMIVFRKKDLK